MVAIKPRESNIRREVGGRRSKAETIPDECVLTVYRSDDSGRMICKSTSKTEYD